jgi:hypothetical protein
MKQISKEIITFLHNFTPLKTSNGISSTNFSRASRNFLKDIFILMRQGDEYFEKHKDKIVFTVKDRIPISNDFNYMPEKIRNIITNMKSKCYEYNFIIYTKKYNVSFYIENNDKMDLDKELKKIFLWFFIANAYANEECSQYLNINLYLTGSMKVLPTKTEQTIKPEHANTAYTTSCKKNAEINLFRKEEWFKVLIHETFHCSGMDFSELDHSSSNKKVLAIFPVNSDVRLFETYCEMWAEIINVMFISYNKLETNENLNEEMYHKMILHTEKLIYYERLFSLFQCAKVLHYFGIKYKNLYENDLYSKQLRTRRYREETQVLSYYIIKSIYMFFVNDFIEWCVENNDENGVVSLNFNKTGETIDSYIDFIKEHYLNSSYTGSILLFENWFEKIDNTSISNEMYNTLRMSVNEE